MPVNIVVQRTTEIPCAFKLRSRRYLHEFVRVSREFLLICRGNARRRCFLNVSR
jgi:hypothetical protein